MICGGSALDRLGESSVQSSPIGLLTICVCVIVQVKDALWEGASDMDEVSQIWDDQADQSSNMTVNQHDLSADDGSLPNSPVRSAHCNPSARSVEHVAGSSRVAQAASQQQQHQDTSPTICPAQQTEQDMAESRLQSPTRITKSPSMAPEANQQESQLQKDDHWQRVDTDPGQLLGTSVVELQQQLALLQQENNRLKLKLGSVKELVAARSRASTPALVQVPSDLHSSVTAVSPGTRSQPTVRASLHQSVQLRMFHSKVNSHLAQHAPTALHDDTPCNERYRVFSIDRSSSLRASESEAKCTSPLARAATEELQETRYDRRRPGRLQLDRHNSQEVSSSMPQTATCRVRQQAGALHHSLDLKGNHDAFSRPHVSIHASREVDTAQAIDMEGTDSSCSTPAGLPGWSSRQMLQESETRKSSEAALRTSATLTSRIHCGSHPHRLSTSSPVTKSTLAAVGIKESACSPGWNVTAPGCSAREADDCVYTAADTTNETVCGNDACDETYEALMASAAAVSCRGMDDNISCSVMIGSQSVQTQPGLPDSSVSNATPLQDHADNTDACDTSHLSADNQLLTDEQSCTSVDMSPLPHVNVEPSDEPLLLRDDAPGSAASSCQTTAAQPQQLEDDDDQQPGLDGDTSSENCGKCSKGSANGTAKHQSLNVSDPSFKEYCGQLAEQHYEASAAARILDITHSSSPVQPANRTRSTVRHLSLAEHSAPNPLGEAGGDELPSTSALKEDCEVLAQQLQVGINHLRQSPEDLLHTMFNMKIE